MKWNKKKLVIEVIIRYVLQTFFFCEVTLWWSKSHCRWRKKVWKEYEVDVHQNVRMSEVPAVCSGIFVLRVSSALTCLPISQICSGQGRAQSSNPPRWYILSHPSAPLLPPVLLVPLFLPSSCPFTAVLSFPASTFPPFVGRRPSLDKLKRMGLNVAGINNAQRNATSV